MSSFGGSSSAVCACLDDPDYQHGSESFSIGRHWRTEFTAADSAMLTNPSPVTTEAKAETTDSFWLGDEETADIDGIVAFAVCRVASINFNIVYDRDAGDDHYLEFRINGELIDTVSLPLLLDGSELDHTLLIAGDDCENEISVRGVMDNPADGRVWIQVIITNVLAP